MVDSEKDPVVGITAPLRRLVDAGAHYVGLPAWRGYSGATWLEGLILAESGGDPRATRYEPRLDREADGDQPDRDDGMNEDDKSYGLMQVMGSNLRQMVGVDDVLPGEMDFSWALLPMANLAFGLRLLSSLLREANLDVAEARGAGVQAANTHVFALEGAVDLALARYNGGEEGNRARDWPGLRNRPYVERVAQHAEVARGRRKALGWVEVG